MKTASTHTYDYDHLMAYRHGDEDHAENVERAARLWDAIEAGA